MAKRSCWRPPYPLEPIAEAIDCARVEMGLGGDFWGMCQRSTTMVCTIKATRNLILH